MLNRLLDLLATGGVHTPGELAVRLGVTDGLLDQMLADLSRMGYLRQVGDPTCSPSPDAHAGQCAGCSLIGACAAGRPGGRMWALTGKALCQNSTK
jgi:DNA-binding IclR family transcriptional regulator